VRLNILGFSILAVGLFLLTGCGDNSASSNSTTVVNEHSECRHGPNGGDLFDIESHDIVGELGYNKTNNVITIFLLEADEATPYPIKADNIVVNYTGGKEPESYTLAAVDPTADGKSAEFALDSKPLSMVIFMPCEIVMQDGEKKITINLPKRHRHNH
jgi:hypothetical protein